MFVTGFGSLMATKVMPCAFDTFVCAALGRNPVSAGMRSGRVCNEEDPAVAGFKGSTNSVYYQFQIVDWECVGVSWKRDIR